MKKLLFLIATVLTISACSTSNITKATQSPLVYQEKPKTILIMPPINKTVHVEAKEYFYTSLAMPLCEKGYYVISPNLAMDFFQSESAYDSEVLIEGSLTPFATIFGADAVMFTVINGWNRSTVGNTVSVDIDYILKSTQTGETLFRKRGVVTVDCSVNSGGVLGVVASVVNTAMTDRVIAARRCNYFLLQDLPDGLYSPIFDKDGSVKVGPATVKAVIKK